MRMTTGWPAGWVACVAALALSLTGCGGSDDTAAPDGTSPERTSPPGEPSPTGQHPTGPAGTTGPDDPDPAASCPERTLDRLNLAERVGQLFMGGVQVGESPAFVSQKLADTHVGSVLFIGQLTGGTDASARAAERARTVAGSPGGARPFVAVDQEGGLVQHLKGPGFSTMPSAQEQAEMSTDELRAAAASWGEELRAGGIDVDLAPVADVVPEDIGAANEPVGAIERGYGSDAQEVSSYVEAFVEGMDAAGVATAVKHFPGLGKVEGNTDFSSGVVDTRTSRDDPDLAPFGAGLDAGAEFLMVSLATYDRIDPERRAVFSPTIIDGMIRDDLGFDGVVVSDDLAAAAEVQSVPPGERALNFLEAGGDIVIASTAEVLPEMTQAVIDRAGSDPAFAGTVDEHALRVLETKARMGLLNCSG
ncbi:beta-N-acetylhexosaminidase [Haloactinopolyspora alba]|uniref:beta-N-acetylhexosaminidase n=1 Tax=Haloactinopolyspora alba TaxID=648780 RepID=A0A2P8DKV6_9ACTN|nr:glycoside hydrolase family 3 N-terminal domain-containing protein [Haloactinopolyspora alba]PSK97856.1 beta-N-acetylhexosaminidase [Haloactinopolyspora alba]